MTFRILNFFFNASSISSNAKEPLLRDANLSSCENKKPTLNFFKNIETPKKKRAVTWIEDSRQSELVINKIIDRGIFALGVGLVALNIDTLLDQRRKYLEEKRKHLSTHESKRILLKAKQKIALEGISLIGMSATAIDWAHEAKILSLGKIQPQVQGVSKIMTFLVSSAKTIKAFRFLKESYSKFVKKLPEVGTKAFLEKNRRAFLDVTAYSTSAAWAILELSSMIAGIVLFPLLSNILILLSIAFGLSSVFYKHHLKKQKGA